ncbi:MAG: DUF2946 family protein [Glycocaulis sp.]
MLTRPSLLRHCLALLALAGALTGGLMPSGWMPDAHGDGRFSLVICTADGPLTLTLNAHGEPVDADDASSGARDTRCDFASLAGPALLPDTPVLLAVTHPQSLVIKGHSEALARNPVILPGQRGPPSLPDSLFVSV